MDMVLVTPRNAVWTQWNAAALHQHCLKTTTKLYRFNAEDVTKQNQSYPIMRHCLIIEKMKENKLGKLPNMLELAVGTLKVMVKFNIATKTDLTNRTRGTVQQIFLDPHEPPHISKTSVIDLQYPPSLVYFVPDNPTTIHFDSIPTGTIPIEPSKVGFTLYNINKTGVHMMQHQYTFTAGYTFTDYKLQGQTIDYVIVNIQKPATGGASVSPFSAYVTLSHSQGQDNIQILCGFNHKLFDKPPCPELILADTRFKQLDLDTQNSYIVIL
jgi:hypothetical protein